MSAGAPPITLMYQAATMQEEKRGRTSLKKIFPELPHNSLLTSHWPKLCHMALTAREAKELKYFSGASI